MLEASLVRGLIMAISYLVPLPNEVMVALVRFVFFTE